MPDINITLPDGAVRPYPAGVTPADIAKSISEGLARNVLAAQIDGKTVDSNTPIERDAKLKLLTWTDLQGKEVYWHSSAHLMAEALEQLFPGIKLAIGPPVANGFYYDVDLEEGVISLEDAERIEQKMLELAKTNAPFERRAVSKAEAIEYFTQKGDPYKLELIDGLEDGQITFYSQGNFTDLCRGPHIPNTGFIKAAKITNVAGAYWRGDSSRKQLTRIYGITFPKAAELKEYLERQEEAKKRDHRKLGREMELFTFSERVGMGLPLWLPKGAALRERLENFMRQSQKKRGYVQVITPHIGNKALYETSGHYQKYKDDSFKPIATPNEGEEFMLKPMNCPHHCEIYASKPRSYRDLPLRLAEFGTVYRYEQSGELHGLTRVRGFTQDDAHVFCRPDQVKEEFLVVVDLVLMVFRTLGFDNYTAQISLRDPANKGKYLGSDEDWEKAERAIIEAVAEKGLPSVTELGEAAFYGPKLDFMVNDALGRRWQLGTIQVDYQMPQRFELEYVGADNQRHRPVMIHRAPFGSLERFIAVLLEHTGGNLPLWLQSEQAVVLPVSEKYNEYAEQVAAYLNERDVRTELDLRDEKVGRKILDAEKSRIPFMLVVGGRDMEAGTVSVRRKSVGELGAMPMAQFADQVLEEVAGMMEGRPIVKHQTEEQRSTSEE
jgi:threonyl-tRNA synthetase